MSWKEIGLPSKAGHFFLEGKRLPYFPILSFCFIRFTSWIQHIRECSELTIPVPLAQTAQASKIESQVRSSKIVQRYSSSKMQREARHLWINICVRKLASTFDNHKHTKATFMFGYVLMLSDALRSVPLEVGPLMMTFKYAPCLFLPVRFQGPFNLLCFF